MHPVFYLENDTDYADDIALIRFTYGCSVPTEKSRGSCKRGVDINPKKTECMAFGEDGDLKTIENANIKKVLNFLYLEHGLAHPRQTSKFERQKHGQHSIKCMSSGSLV